MFFDNREVEYKADFGYYYMAIGMNGDVIDHISIHYTLTHHYYTSCRHHTNYHVRTVYSLLTGGEWTVTSFVCIPQETDEIEDMIRARNRSILDSFVETAGIEIKYDHAITFIQPTLINK